MGAQVKKEGTGSTAGKQKYSKEVYFAVLPDKYEPLIEELEEEVEESAEEKKEDKKRKKKQRYKKYRKVRGVDFVDFDLSWSAFLPLSNINLRYTYKTRLCT